MICVNCGKETGDGSFCIGCGVSLDIQRKAEQERLQQHVTQASQHAGQSSYNGTGFDILVMSIVCALIVLVTFGFGAPWAICYEVKEIASKTTLSGRQVRFTGKGGELFPIYILGMLLTVITIGIYSFWFIKNIYKYIASHIELY